MAQGFNRDVTTPIDIPKVQAPDFTKSSSTVGDLTQLATFAIGISNMSEAKAQEKVRQTKVQEAGVFVDDLVTRYGAMIDGGKSESTAKILIQKDISFRGTPSLSSHISSEFLKRTQGINVDEVKESDEPDAPESAFSLNSKNEFGRKAMGSLGFTNVPPVGSPEMDLLDKRTIEVINLDTQYNNNQKAIDNGNIKTKAAANGVLTNVKEMISFQFSPIVLKAEELLDSMTNLPSGQQASLMEELRQTVAVLEQTGNEFINKSFIGVSPELATTATESAKASLNTVLSLYKGQDASAMSLASRNLKFLQDNLNQDLFQSGNTLKLIADTYGQAIPALTWDIMTKNLALSGSFEEAAESSLGLTPELKKSLELQDIHSYVNGGGTIATLSNLPTTPEQKANIFKIGFMALEGASDSGGVLDLDKFDSATYANATINVLQDANSQDKATTDRILNWVGSEKYKEFLKGIDPKQAQGIGNMVITTARDSVTAPDSISTLSSNISLDASTGKFSMVNSNIPEASNSRHGFIAGGVSRQQALAERDKLQGLNKRVKNFLDYADQNEALKGLNIEQKLSWLLVQGSGDKLSSEVSVTNGDIGVGDVDIEAAVKQNKDVEDYKKQRAVEEEAASLPSQVKGLKEEIDKLRSTGVTQEDGDDKATMFKLLEDNPNLTFTEIKKLMEEGKAK